MESEMLRSKKLVGIFAAVVALGLHAGTASANLDLSELGAALVTPIITSFPLDVQNPSFAVTYTTITNASNAGINLHINVVNGDPGGNWSASSFDCWLSAHETTLFVFAPTGLGTSQATYECSEIGAGPTSTLDRLNIQNTTAFSHATGIMFVAVEKGDPLATSLSNVILGDWVTIDYLRGTAYSAEAISFQGKTAVGPKAEDQTYAFDGLEYASFPSVLATNFIAPVGPKLAPQLKAELVLFTLDGSIANTPVPVKFAFDYYNDDERKRDGIKQFDCFAVIDLLDLSPNFEDRFLGSAAGHLVMTPVTVSPVNQGHDNNFGDGNGSRKSPFHGWLVQTILVGGTVGGGLVPVPPPAIAATAADAWARTLINSTQDFVPAGTDVVTFETH
jgi:hypothetical protein